MDISKIRKKFKESRKEKEGVPPGLTGDSSVLSKEGVQEVAVTDVIIKPITGEDETRIQETLEDNSTVEIVELLVFSLYNEEYAFKVSELEEIIRPQQITLIPRTPEYLLGVTSLRGKIIPVIDLKKMLLLTGKGESKRQKIIILKGNRGPMGVRVDKISGVVRLPVSELTESPPHLNESQLRYIDQVAILNNRFISIINTEEIMNIM